MAGLFSFLLGKKKEKPQVELSQWEEKKSYDLTAALAKTLLVFALSFGAVNGFLTAYGMEYRRVLCGGGILGVALLLSLIYETEKKWFTNLCVIGIFLVYAYMAVSRFWVLNSGAYAVINRAYEVAQNYLGVTGGGLYSLQVEDTRYTVTAIALFVGVVLDILFVLRLQYKASLLRTVIITFTLYLLPIYFERTPDLFSLFLLLTGYVTMAILQFGGVKKHISGQIKQVLPVGMAIAAVTVLLFGMLLPRVRYRTLVPKNPKKAATEDSAVMFAQYGVMALLMNNMAGGGINAGRLSQNVTVMPDNETDLIVRFTPYSMEPVYLKAFTGQRYDGHQWSEVPVQSAADDVLLTEEANARKELYEKDSQKQARGVMEVILVEPSLEYSLLPYYTDGESARQKGTPQEGGTGTSYVYYPVVSDAALQGFAGDEVSDDYLEVPRICRDAVEKACREAALTGTPEQIAAQIFRYFSTKFSYTLRPGYYFGGMDYISYFLERNKKGFCTHFASAGTMLFRYMGIPARYVEGYVFSYTDVVTDGVIVEDASYEEYYDGYSPLGDTALVELEVPDAQAHAWVEIYLPDRGWTLVDVTPAAILDEEETGGFWDSILNGGIQNRVSGEQAEEAADYLENALAGGVGVLGFILFAVFAFFAGRWAVARYRESKLPGRERVRREYMRLTAPLKEREETFARLTTPEEELQWMKEVAGAQVPDGLQEDLYRLFFGPEEDWDYERLRGQLAQLRDQVKRGRAKSRY